MNPPHSVPQRFKRNDGWVWVLGAFAFTNELSTFAGYEMLKYVSFPVQVGWRVRWKDVLLPVRKNRCMLAKSRIVLQTWGMLEKKLFPLWQHQKTIYGS